MTDINTGDDLINTTSAIKKMEIKSDCDIRNISELDMKKFVYTGWTATITTPMVKNSSNAILAVRTDGWIPCLNKPPTIQQLEQINLPVIQPVYKGPNSNIGILVEQTPLPQMAMMMSNRYMGGSIATGMRITSNTAQSGNLMIVHATGVMRKFNNHLRVPAQPYVGLQMLNSSPNPIDYAPGGFAITDLSINRTCNIVATRRDNMKATDTAQRLLDINTGGVSDPYNLNLIYTQFVEDYLLIAPLTDLPTSGGVSNTISISIFYDFSRVQFYEPMLPMIPILNLTEVQQILDWMATFYNKLSVLPADYIFK